MFRDNEIIFLLGAGCSVEADIPHASAMISDIESKIEKDDDWKKFKDIYNLLKSSVFYARGIRGNFETSLNIEELVNLLNELVKRDEATLFAFIGTWNPKLIAIAGHDFRIIEEFKNKILVQLKDWINLPNFLKMYQVISYKVYHPEEAEPTTSLLNFHWYTMPQHFSTGWPSFSDRIHPLTRV